MTELIVALDVPTVVAAADIVGRLSPLGINHWKIGPRLLLADGSPTFIKILTRNDTVMLDLKLHDIPETVGGAVVAAEALGIDGITVRVPSLQVATDTAVAIGVWAVDELSSERIALSPAFIRAAEDAGCDGLIVPPTELLDEVPDSLSVAYVGVRPAGEQPGSHLSTITPARARALGADYVIVGRPITRAADLRAAALAILEDLK